MEAGWFPAHSSNSQNGSKWVYNLHLMINMTDFTGPYSGQVLKSLKAMNHTKNKPKHHFYLKGFEINK